MSEDDPYRDPRAGQRIHDERRREEQEERALFQGAVRPRLSRRRVVWLVLVLAGVGGALAVGLHAKAKVPASAPSAASSVAISDLLPPVACDTLRGDYDAAVEKARACTQDSDCTAEPRGKLMTGLDGCARFVVRSKDLLVADDRARRWQAGGCAGAYRTCPLPRGAICEQKQCVELPPPGVPRTWHRLDLPGVYSFFAPGDLWDNGLGGMVPEDSWITRFSSKTQEIFFDVQRGDDSVADGGVPERETEGIRIHSEELMLGGARARLDLTRRLGGDAGGPMNLSVFAPSVPAQTAPGNPLYGTRPVAVGVSTTCNTKADCDEVIKIFHTFEAW